MITACNSSAEIDKLRAEVESLKEEQNVQKHDVEDSRESVENEIIEEEPSSEASSTDMKSDSVKSSTTSTTNQKTSDTSNAEATSNIETTEKSSVNTLEVPGGWLPATDDHFWNRDYNNWFVNEWEERPFMIDGEEWSNGIGNEDTIYFGGGNYAASYTVKNDGYTFTEFRCMYALDDITFKVNNNQKVEVLISDDTFYYDGGFGTWDKGAEEAGVEVLDYFILDSSNRSFLTQIEISGYERIWIRTNHLYEDEYYLLSLSPALKKE